MTLCYVRFCISVLGSLLTWALCKLPVVIVFMKYKYAYLFFQILDTTYISITYVIYRDQNDLDDGGAKRGDGGFVCIAAVSRGHFVALPLCVLGQFSRITSAVMRLGRHHQTSSRGSKEEFYGPDKKHSTGNQSPKDRGIVSYYIGFIYKKKKIRVIIWMVIVYL